MLDRWLAAILSAACGLLAGACGGAASAAPSTPAGAPSPAADPAPPGAGASPRTPPSRPAPVSLTITSTGSATARLTCVGTRSAATGFLRPRAVAACAAARRLVYWLASRPNRTAPCTQIYGGPQRARVAGRVADIPIDRSFSRRDGCQIADWNRAQALLPRLPAAPSG